MTKNKKKEEKIERPCVNCGKLYTPKGKPICLVCERCIHLAVGEKLEWFCKDEYYCNWYKCPYCESDAVMERSNFCNKCGGDLRHFHY